MLIYLLKKIRKIRLSILNILEKDAIQKNRPCSRTRIGQGFWVYGIQGLFKSDIRYIAA